MSTIKIAFILIASFGLSYCGSTQKKDQPGSDQVHNEQTAATMEEEGFLKGVIRYSAAEGDCPYVIEVESTDYNYMLDPVNLESEFMTDGVQIWFKFAGLRRPNRCEKASPVNLLEIQRRN